MPDKVKSFKDELKALFGKYNVKVKNYDQYDGEEMYAGTIQYFDIDGEQTYDTVEDIINELCTE